MASRRAYEAIEESYKKALQEQDIKPAGQPRVDITKLVAGNDVEFKIRVPLEPDVHVAGLQENCKVMCWGSKRQIYG